MKVVSHIPHLSYKSEMRVPGCEIRDARCGIRDPGFKARISYLASRNSHPASRITYLVSCSIDRAVNGRRGSSYGRTAI